jgi:hypothetical protein
MCNTIVPDYTNQCSTKNEEYTIPGWCSNFFNTGGQAEACKNLGNLNGESEWDVSSADKGCFFQTGTVNQCISGAGGITGKNVTCSHARFFGDRRTCCRQDYTSNGVNSNCFTNNGKATCDPEYRGPINTGCRLFYEDYCVSGNPPGSNPDAEGTYSSKWLGTNSECTVALSKNYNEGGSGLDYSQKLFSELLNKYLETNSFVPNGPKYSPFQDRILELARLYPLASAPALQSYCTGFSRSDLENNLPLTNLCGCYLNSDQYTTVENQLGVPIQCDSVCSLATNIPRVENNEVLRCNQTLCIIDDVSVNLVNSSLETLSFQQLCGNCRNAQCSCSIVNLNINAENSKIGNINLEQECSSSNCYKVNPNTGSLVVVDCFVSAEEQERQAEEGSNDQENEQEQEDNKKAWRIVFIVSAVVLFFLFILALYFLLRPDR